MFNVDVNVFTDRAFSILVFCAQLFLSLLLQLLGSDIA